MMHMHGIVPPALQRGFGFVRASAGLGSPVILLAFVEAPLSYVFLELEEADLHVPTPS